MDESQLEAWEGDIEILHGSAEKLSYDPALCERIFADEHEAFVAGMHLGARSGLSKAATAAMRDILRLPWRSVDLHIEDVLESLKLLMLLTPNEFARWENELVDVLESEFSIPVEEALELDMDVRFAHVARLIRTLAMSLGLRTDYALRPEAVHEHIADIEPESPLFVLRLLDNLSLEESTN